jgi:hypothetical protein
MAAVLVAANVHTGRVVALAIRGRSQAILICVINLRIGTQQNIHNRLLAELDCRVASAR